MKRLKLTPPLKTGCLVLVILFAIQSFINPIALVDNIVTVNRIRAELPKAKARWMASGIKDYQIDVAGGVPLGCSYHTRLTIQNTQLAAVQVRKNPLDEASPFVTREPASWDTQFGCSYSELVVEAMFRRVEQALDDNLLDSSLKVNFDEQYGYVTDYATDFGYRTGGVSECCVWFKYSNFKPVQR